MSEIVEERIKTRTWYLHEFGEQYKVTSEIELKTEQIRWLLRIDGKVADSMRYIDRTRVVSPEDAQEFVDRIAYEIRGYMSEKDAEVGKSWIELVSPIIARKSPMQIVYIDR